MGRIRKIGSAHCNYSQILYQFLTFTQNLKRSPISGADPPVIPVTGEISPDDCLKFIRSHFLCIITII